MKIQRPSRITASAGVPERPAPASRGNQLRLELLATVESLRRRRADLVGEGFIADYVSLHWLEWHGGTLRLTVTGTNVCAQIRAGLI